MPRTDGMTFITSICSIHGDMRLVGPNCSGEGCGVIAGWQRRDHGTRYTHALWVIGAGVLGSTWPLSAQSNDGLSGAQEWTLGGRTLSALAGQLAPRSVAATSASFEDVTVRVEVNCAEASTCDFGVLTNATPTSDGWTGLYTHVTPGGISLGTATVSAA